MNKIVLVGHLGKDPEMRSTQSGTNVTSFSLATNDGYGDNKKTNWHNIVVFGKTAESVATYLSKGSLAAVVGSVQYRSWEKKDGSGKAYATEVLADSVEFLDGNKSNSNSNDSSSEEITDDDIPF